MFFIYLQYFKVKKNAGIVNIFDLYTFTNLVFITISI